MVVVVVLVVSAGVVCVASLGELFGVLCSVFVLCIRSVPYCLMISGQRSDQIFETTVGDAPSDTDGFRLRYCYPSLHLW